MHHTPKILLRNTELIENQNNLTNSNGTQHYGIIDLFELKSVG